MSVQSINPAGKKDNSVPISVGAGIGAGAVAGGVKYSLGKSAILKGEGADKFISASLAAKNNLAEDGIAKTLRSEADALKAVKLVEKEVDGVKTFVVEGTDKLSEGLKATIDNLKPSGEVTEAATKTFNDKLAEQIKTAENNAKIAASPKEMLKIVQTDEAVKSLTKTLAETAKEEDKVALLAKNADLLGIKEIAEDTTKGVAKQNVEDQIKALVGKDGALDAKLKEVQTNVDGNIKKFNLDSLDEMVQTVKGGIKDGVKNLDDKAKEAVKFVKKQAGNVNLKAAGIWGAMVAIPVGIATALVLKNKAAKEQAAEQPIEQPAEQPVV